MQVDALLSDLLAGQRRALARAISEVENESPRGFELLRSIQPHLGRARVVGITGAPGAGKSTLISALITELGRRDQRIGVVAVDPSSPLTGGAILGDRVRMHEHFEADHVFIRSLSSRGHLGGLSAATSRVVDVMDAAGIDLVLVETVGTGQNEVEIADLADTRVVICPPDLGDEVQAIKAGILEIGDIFVVNKGDLPLAEYARQALLSMVSLREGDSRPAVIKVSALSGEGVGELATALAGHSGMAPGATRRGGSAGRMRRLIAHLASEQVRRAIADMEGAELEGLCRGMQTGDVGTGEAVRKAVRLAANKLG